METKSFRQFEYCTLCKLSHKKRKKHVYSKRHKIIVQNILNKFSAKVLKIFQIQHGTVQRDSTLQCLVRRQQKLSFMTRRIGENPSIIDKMKANLFSPEAIDDSIERQAKFWCYFCVAEFDRHTQLENCTISGSGILHHIASDEHKLGTEKFVWDNLLPKELKPKFLLSKEDLHIVQRASLLAVKKLQRERTIERKKITESIIEMEAKRKINTMTESWQSEIVASSSSASDLPGNRQRDVPDLDSEKIEAGYTSLGLTRINRPADDSSDGNVHTGATPPWLQKNSIEDGNTGEIGPTMVDFQKHLEKEKKAKLPSCRVGAKFDHNSSTSSDWLPSFGRVWSKGRRLQSKLHFEKHLKGKTPLNPSKGKGPKSSLSRLNQQNSAIEHIPAVNGVSQNTNKRTGDFNTNHSQHNVYRQSETDQFVPSSTSSSHNQSGYTNFEHNSPRNVTVIPYKRRKKDCYENGRDIQLLQTPVLSKQK